MSIIDVSRRKAEHGEAWTLEDHGALVDHLSQVSRLSQDSHDQQEQQHRMERLQRVYRQTNGVER